MAARNRTCGYRKSMQCTPAERPVYQAPGCATENLNGASFCAEIPASQQVKKPLNYSLSETHLTEEKSAPHDKVNTPEKQSLPPNKRKASGLKSVRLGSLIKITAFWLLVFSLSHALTDLSGEFIGHTLPTGTSLVILFLIYFSFLIRHHFLARKNRRIDKYLTFHSGEGFFNASLPLSVYIPKEWGEMISSMARNTCLQMKDNDLPVVMRSHLLCYRRQRNIFLRELAKENIRWEMTAEPESPRGWRRFMLYWATPIVIGSFQYRLPSLGRRECEMKLSRSP